MLLRLPFLERGYPSQQSPKHVIGPFHWDERGTGARGAVHVTTDRATDADVHIRRPCTLSGTDTRANTQRLQLVLVSAMLLPDLYKKK